MFPIQKQKVHHFLTLNESTITFIFFSKKSIYGSDQCPMRTDISCHLLTQLFV